jgi:hypothetical protein
VEVLAVARKAKKPEQTIQSTMRLPVDVWEAIRSIADRKRLSMQQAVIFAIEEYVEREKGRK